MPNFISEDDIEQAILQRLHDHYGYERLNCFTADPNNLSDRSNRTDKRQVILRDRLRTAAQRLNPDLPDVAIEKAITILTSPRATLSPIAANTELDAHIRNGIDVPYTNPDGKTERGRVRLIDFNDPSQNKFLAVSQLWIQGDPCYRRPDILLYINGLPIVFIELKNSNVKLKTAYDDNLANYKHDIPQLFHTNAFCILSNALDTKVGSFTAPWDYFFNWLRPEDESEKLDRQQIQDSGTSLERAIDGLCAKPKLLDYLENFIVYYKETQKIIAQNHQFIGVNKAIDAFANRQEKAGKLGVFWHTQGSGKSFSMVFLARKIFRKFTGNFSFLIVTDRDDLDGQIYRNFLHTNTVNKKEQTQPKNSQQLREYLSQNKRIVFTLIQKFRYDKGKQYPLLSDRDDIIVIVDEAHRTQYKSLAENMRAGLKNAQFIAFTGTPLLGKDRKTNQWFGDYISEYTFTQSAQDGATVPLYYQKRVPEVLNQNEDLSEEFYEILEDENLDDIQQAKLEQKFAREIEIIKRDDRLEDIAKDIVYHFPRRGYLGKGMVISLDKFTAVKMYDKVQHHWKASIKTLRGQIKKSTNDLEKVKLKKILDFMRRTEMAVVISEDAAEAEKFAAQGLEIKTHRDRLNTVDQNGKDVEDNFKDPEHPLQLVFVCAMWLTGFDAPTVSTLYLDKPMKDHTLMQTITRANRVSDFAINGVMKRNGEIIDYYNVFRNMKKALASYAIGSEDGAEVPPIQEKSTLLVLLDEAIEAGVQFCQDRDIDINSILRDKAVFDKLGQFKTFADILLSKDEWRKSYFVYENTISSLYEACKPEIFSEHKRPLIAVFQYLRGVIESIIDRQDINAVAQKIGTLLDESVVTPEKSSTPYREKPETYNVIKAGKNWDLSQLNIEELKTEFKQQPYQNIEITDLRSFIDQKLQKMLQQNVTRQDFAQRLQNIIDQYNAGASSTENYFEDLLKFTQDLNQESARHIRLGLSEEELELFDLLKKEKMTQAETQAVKLTAQALLQRLIEEHPKVLIQDWYREDQSKRTVQDTVEEILDKQLPNTYDRKLFKTKCDNVFNLIVTYSMQGKKWAA